eukprot:TRINITY_DN4222_c0_g1_i1.p2 TRINITY_DN4222_c0_g1~~TRINITY_DN4222_c0_g1_i1.p2  ORF type:complete len:298 (+),score=82.84 TRINITY_DN4222_c0_g1_i1:60-953(+)
MRRAQAAPPASHGAGACGGYAPFVTGAAAGCISKTLTAPLARLTILRQVAAGDLQAAAPARGMVAELAGLAKKGGVAALFRGNSAAICHRIPFSGVYHGTYSFLKVQQARYIGVAGDGVAGRLVNGSIAGGAACTVAYPLDLARSLIASGRSASVKILPTLYGEVRRCGMGGVYRGLCPTLLSVTPNLGVNYCVYDTVRASRQVAHPTAATLVAAAAAGVASSLATHPLDLLRRVCQIDGAAGQQAKYDGRLLRAAASIYRHNPLAMWRGLAPELVKVVPSVCLTFTAFELMQHALV